MISKETLLKYEEVLIGLFVVIVIIVSYLSFGKKSITPSQVVLQVPFTTQAPNGNWSRNEDCEETSVSMANAFLDGQREDRMPAKDAQNAINQLKNWENINAGYNMNSGADATTNMAEGAFKLHVEQISDFTEDDLKNALAGNKVVLMPLNAKVLNQARYGDNGPLYHMIVIRGYVGDTFIVNDPGTNEGDGNQYYFETIQKAAADWNQSTNSIDPTSKIALVLSK